MCQLACVAGFIEVIRPEDKIDEKPVYFCAGYGYVQRAFGSKLQQVT
jgi:hypothetical protein